MLGKSWYTLKFYFNLMLTFTFTVLFFVIIMNYSDLPYDLYCSLIVLITLNGCIDLYFTLYRWKKKQNNTILKSGQKIIIEAEELLKSYDANNSKSV